MPSIVLMLLPFTCATGTRQLFTIWPSRMTVHAPHSPSPQPSFVPVRCNCSLKTSSSRAIGKTSTVRDSPLMLKVISIVFLQDYWICRIYRTHLVHAVNRVIL